VAEAPEHEGGIASSGMGEQRDSSELDVKNQQQEQHETHLSQDLHEQIMQQQQQQLQPRDDKKEGNVSNAGDDESDTGSQDDAESGLSRQTASLLANGMRISNSRSGRFGDEEQAILVDVIRGDDELRRSFLHKIRSRQYEKKSWMHEIATRFNMRSSSKRSLDAVRHHFMQRRAGRDSKSALVWHAMRCRRRESCTKCLLLDRIRVESGLASCGVAQCRICDKSRPDVFKPFSPHKLLNWSKDIAVDVGAPAESPLFLAETTASSGAEDRKDQEHSSMLSNPESLLSANSPLVQQQKQLLQAQLQQQQLLQAQQQPNMSLILEQMQKLQALQNLQRVQQQQQQQQDLFAGTNANMLSSLASGNNLVGNLQQQISGLGMTPTAASLGVGGSELQLQRQLLLLQQQQMLNKMLELQQAGQHQSHLQSPSIFPMGNEALLSSLLGGPLERSAGGLLQQQQQLQTPFQLLASSTSQNAEKLGEHTSGKRKAEYLDNNSSPSPKKTLPTAP